MAPVSRSLSGVGSGDSTLTHEPHLRIFVSHSAKDRLLAEQLVKLLRSALNLTAAAIRCTSVDGYRLPGGANTDEQLRREVHAADAFVGIVSSASLQSLYVLFELGARWGAQKHLLPLLAPGTDTSALRGPLAALSALRSDKRPELHQLVSDLAVHLRIRPQPPDSYEAEIEGLLTLAAGPPSSEPNLAPDGQADFGGVSEAEINILKYLSKDIRASERVISAKLKLSRIRTRYLIDQLVDRTLIAASREIEQPAVYCLTKAGRKYLVDRGLVA
jgi:hypothetical protein